MTEKRQTVTEFDVQRAMTPAGGFTRATLESWGIAWPPKAGWRKAIKEGWFDEYLENQKRPVWVDPRQLDLFQGKKRARSSRSR